MVCTLPKAPTPNIAVAMAVEGRFGVQLWTNTQHLGPGAWEIHSIFHTNACMLTHTHARTYTNTPTLPHIHTSISRLEVLRYSQVDTHAPHTLAVSLAESELNRHCTQNNYALPIFNTYATNF